MPAFEPSKHLPLPKQWSRQVQSVVLHVISLAQYALTEARGWAADSVNPRLRLLSQAAAKFLVSPETISSWVRRLDERGVDATPEGRLSQPGTDGVFGRTGLRHRRFATKMQLKRRAS